MYLSVYVTHVYFLHFVPLYHHQQQRKAANRKKAQESYQDELKRQIEEKKRRKDEEKRKIEAEEAREVARLEKERVALEKKYKKEMGTSAADDVEIETAVNPMRRGNTRLSKRQADSRLGHAEENGDLDNKPSVSRKPSNPYDNDDEGDHSHFHGLDREELFGGGPVSKSDLFGGGGGVSGGRRDGPPMDFFAQLESQPSGRAMSASRRSSHSRHGARSGRGQAVNIGIDELTKFKNELLERQEQMRTEILHQQEEVIGGLLRNNYVDPHAPQPHPHGYMGYGGPPHGHHSHHHGGGAHSHYDDQSDILSEFLAEQRRREPYVGHGSGNSYQQHQPHGHHHQHHQHGPPPASSHSYMDRDAPSSRGTSRRGSRSRPKLTSTSKFMPMEHGMAATPSPTYGHDMSPRRPPRSRSGRSRRRPPQTPSIDTPMNPNFLKSLQGNSVLLAMEESMQKGLDPFESSLSSESKWLRPGDQLAKAMSRPPSSRRLHSSSRRNVGSSRKNRSSHTKTADRMLYSSDGMSPAAGQAFIGTPILLHEEEDTVMVDPKSEYSILSKKRASNDGDNRQETGLDGSYEFVSSQKQQERDVRLNGSHDNDSYLQVDLSHSTPRGQRPVTGSSSMTTGSDLKDANITIKTVDLTSTLQSNGSADHTMMGPPPPHTPGTLDIDALLAENERKLRNLTDLDGQMGFDHDDDYDNDLNGSQNIELETADSSYL